MDPAAERLHGSSDAMNASDKGDNVKKNLVNEHWDCVTFLNGRDSKKIANNTRVEDLGDGAFGVRLHGTVVVRFYPDGRVQLDSGRYRTVTTKERINRCLPVGWSLYQQDYDWILRHAPTGRVFDFEDGIVLEDAVAHRAEQRRAA